MTKRILVVRNDKLGDFVLALPALKVLKHSMPEAQVAVLVPEYTAPIASVCDFIDTVVVDTPENTPRQLASTLRTYQFDVSICLFSTAREAQALWRAGIRQRYAPATKWYQMFYNHRLTQRRSRSEQPEYQYNIDVVRYFLQHAQRKVQETWRPLLNIAPVSRFTPHTIILHPGSGGSANNLSLAHYIELATALYQQDKRLEIVFSLGPTEAAIQNELVEHMTIPYQCYHSEDGLIDYAARIQAAGCFIAGSTGVLHLAAALDMTTVGYYPQKRSASALRWQTVNQHHLALAVETVDINTDATRIYQHCYA
jgi:ADP-heptose:LPS heptosyltransferase